MPIEPVLQVPLRMPRTDREFSAFVRELLTGLGFTYDGTNWVMPNSATTVARSATTLNAIMADLTDGGALANAMELESRPAVEARNIWQRLGDAGTGNDVRLLPISKTANLGSAIGTNPLSAADAGTDATITVGAFTAQFDFGPVNFSGASITGLSYSTKYKVYLTGATYAGAYTSALATTSEATLTADEQNLYIGTITTPAAAAPPTSGSGGGGRYDP